MPPPASTVERCLAPGVTFVYLLPFGEAAIYFFDITFGISTKGTRRRLHLKPAEMYGVNCGKTVLRLPVGQPSATPAALPCDLYRPLVWAHLRDRAVICIHDTCGVPSLQSERPAHFSPSGSIDVHRQAWAQHIFPLTLLGEEMKIGFLIRELDSGAGDLCLFEL